MNSSHTFHQGRYFLPAIGNRILKTALAVFLCLLIYIIRGNLENAAEACITAIICMQPYARDVRKSALDRLLGTIVGCVLGLLFLLLVTELPGMNTRMLLVCILMTAGVIASLYVCVLLNIADAAALSAIVFLCLVISYQKADPSLEETMLRILDTLIGVFVAIFVNSFRMPTRRCTDRIFFLRLEQLAADRYSQINARVLVELNRLYDAGAKICLETEYAPAFLIGQLQMIHINMPIIVLGGAALYDIRENTYSEVQEIPKIGAYYLQTLIVSMGYCGIFFSLRSNSMMLFQTGKRSRREEEDYRMMRRSPYRNYVEGLFGDADRVLAFRTILSQEEAEVFEERLAWDQVIGKYFQVVRIPRPNHPGEILFYFYKKGVCLETAQQRLMDQEMETEGRVLQKVQILPRSSSYDPERDAIHLIHRIRKQYLQPVWRRRRD